MICWTSFVSIVYFGSKSFFIFQHSVAPLRLYIFDWQNIINVLLFFFRTAFFINVFPQTRKERETQLAAHVSRRRPLRLFYRVPARLSLFPKNSNRGFSFHRCGELFLLYVTSQTTKSQMVPYHLLYPFSFPPFPHLRKKRVGGRERTQLVGLLG